MEPQMNADERGYRLREQRASFDKLRMRDNLNGTKKNPHPELVEGRTTLIPGSQGESWRWP
jgi:hypothetical protein